MLEDLLERMEADAFVGLYSQVRARGRALVPFPASTSLSVFRAHLSRLRTGLIAGTGGRAGGWLKEGPPPQGQDPASSGHSGPHCWASPAIAPLGRSCRGDTCPGSY